MQDFEPAKVIKTEQSGAKENVFGLLEQSLQQTDESIKTTKKLLGVCDSLFTMREAFKEEISNCIKSYYSDSKASAVVIDEIKHILIKYSLYE